MGWLIVFLLFWFSLMLFFTVYYKDLKTHLGSNNLKKELDKLPKDKYLVIDKVVIKSKDGVYHKIDGVVISKYGIFVIKLKNYDGIIKANINDNAWEVNKNNKNKFITNGIKENNVNINALFELTGLSNVFVSIVAFSNSSKIISDYSLVTQICYIDNLILQYNKEVLNNNIFDIKNIILNADMSHELKKDMDDNDEINTNEVNK